MRRNASDGSEPRGSLPLTPVEFHVLLSLSDDARHGYAILQDVEQRTDGQIKLRTGTLYTVIKRMLDGAWLEEQDAGDEDGDARRRYYALTPLGRRVLTAEARRLQSLVAMAQDKRVLAGKKLTPERSR